MSTPRLLFALIILFKINCSNSKVTDKEYALMPALFHLDNYDKCMLMQEKALYCSFTYKLQPLNSKNFSKIWKIIEEVSSNPKNYRHDHLRHGICVPKMCSGVTNINGNETVLKEKITNCYNLQYKQMGLRGKVTDLVCETTSSKYKIDMYDIIAAVAFISYGLFIIFASLYEGIAKYQTKECYEKLTKSTSKYQKYQIISKKLLIAPKIWWLFQIVLIMVLLVPTVNCFNLLGGKIISAFSISKNWIRLKSIKKTEDVEKMRSFQGIRFYNMMIVTLSHSVLVFLITPVINPKYVETINDKFFNIFLSSGGLCVSTFYLISTWLVTYNFFVLFEGKKDISFKILFITFLNRYIRLVPTVAVVVIFHSTWLVHISKGPNWENIIGSEYRKCRKNWWTNLLFINNYIDRENMCLQTTWYLGVDNQIFALSLIVVWFMKKFEEKILHIIGGLLVLYFGVIFTINYVKDFNAFLIPSPESVYMLNMFKTDQFHTQVSSVSFNAGGPIIGFAFGYLYYRYRNKEVFTKKIHVWIWWFVTYFSPLGIIIFPGLLIFNENTNHNAFWASVYVAVNRPIFAFGIAACIFGMTQGIGWMTKWVCEWPPTYVLGRITFSGYLVQMALVKITPGLIRAPIYISDYLIVSQTLSDICLSIIMGTFLTLFFEMPMSELQKMYLFSMPKSPEEKSKKIKQK